MKRDAELALSMLDSAERQVDTWLSDGRFFGNFVFEIPLRLPSHDEQTPRWQSFREHNRAILRFQTKQPFRAQTDRGDDRPHFRFRVGVEPDAVISVSVEITEN